MDNKIIYCYDIKKQIIYHRDAVKENSYFCIDCGEKLIVKDGMVNVKHLSHKSNSNCLGTGESVFHQHWKNNICSKGMFIKVRGMLYEINNVLTEVSLKKRYSKEWSMDIIVDILLETDAGDIVVEINYTNSKCWIDLEDCYKELNLLEIFEVSVGKTVNSNVEWSTMDEKLYDEYESIENANNNRKERDIENKRKAESQSRKDRIYNTDVFFNFKTKAKPLSNNKYSMKCAVKTKHQTKYRTLDLVIDLNSGDIDRMDIFGSNGINNSVKGIRLANLDIIGFDETIDRKQSANMVKINCIKEACYNKDLYRFLCSLKY